MYIEIRGLNYIRIIYYKTLPIKIINYESKSKCQGYGWNS